MLIRQIEKNLSTNVSKNLEEEGIRENKQDKKSSSGNELCSYLLP